MDYKDIIKIMQSNCYWTSSGNEKIKMVDMKKSAIAIVNNLNSKRMQDKIEYEYPEGIKVLIVVLLVLIVGAIVFL